jgi:hypothetical protein
MSDIYLSDYRLERNTHYFLFIGSIRNYGPNIFLAEALSRIYGCKFNFIAIIQDIFEQYSYPNLKVINPRVHGLSAKYDRAVSCRVPTRTFMKCVSQNHQVHELVRTLLNRQKTLYISMYESLPEMTLDEHNGVFVLGPDSNISDRLNSKAYQYESCKNFVPMPDYHICYGRDALYEKTNKLWPDWTQGIFISKEYSAGGLQSIVAHGPDHITEKFQDQKQTYIISRYIPHDHDPTVLAVVANEDDVYIAGIADQIIEHSTRFVGSIFPSTLPLKTLSELQEFTRIIGKWLAREGFRGIFGCDYIVDADGGIYFIEVNARKQGTTMEFCCTLENTLPPESAMLPELEYYAVKQHRFPKNTIEMVENSKNIHWGTHYFKNLEPVSTRTYIPQNRQERTSFNHIAENKIDKEVIILDHIGSNLLATQGSFLARIVALGKDRRSVVQGLGQGKKAIQSSLKAL